MLIPSRRARYGNDRKKRSVNSHHTKVGAIKATITTGNIVCFVYSCRNNKPAKNRNGMEQIKKPYPVFGHRSPIGTINEKYRTVRKSVPKNLFLSILLNIMDQCLPDVAIRFLSLIKIEIPNNASMQEIIVGNKRCEVSKSIVTLVNSNIFTPKKILPEKLGQ